MYRLCSLTDLVIFVGMQCCRSIRVCSLLILLCYSAATFGQQPGASRNELENRRKSIINSIRETQAQLDVTRSDRKASVTELRALQAKLAERQHLIANINQEISSIDNNIKFSAVEIEQLRAKLTVLKMRYAQSVRYSYMNKSSYNMLAFLFSADDFNTAMRRVRYLKKYRDYRKYQAEQIKAMNSNIEQKINVLNLAKSQKSVLRSAEEQQKQVIQKETNEKDRIVSQLKGKENELSREISNNQKSLKSLEKAISAAIRKEIEIARKKAEEERRREEERQRKEEEARVAAAKSAENARNAQEIKVVTGSGTKSAIPGNPRYNAGANKYPSTSKENTPTAAAPTATTPRPSQPKATSYNLSLTPEVAALSDNFEANRGKLPWPVEKGFIAERFGKQKHPVYNIETENNGIEIQTSAGAGVRAVFGGTVTNVFYVGGMGQCVMINHGRFFTLYSRLGSVSVSKGSKVSMKQSLGTVGQNDNGEYLMHFELWKVGANDKSSPQDPSGWIAR
ncbi:MAG TPA: peptidoglycan DD-metalloendopeptidase family protein [Flavipsychrobacter sp.]|nr:peptidoglycan DD-metalloendopeptidase family protein [Flavipsychrobacter sp.]